MGCGCKLRKRITKNKLDITKRDVYLDYNGTTQPDFRVLNEIEKANRLYWGNPSAQNTRGVNLYNSIFNKSREILRLINLESSSFYFDTSSSSIINNIKQSNIHITSSEIEHSSLLNLADRKIEVDNLGYINLNKLEDELKNNKVTTFIYSPVNHEVGVVQNCKDIYNLCKRYSVPVILDSVQTIHRVKFSEWLDYCDGFYFSGHKIHSVPGCAMLILKSEIVSLNINSTIEFSIYSGTINSSGILGLLEALKILILEQDDQLNILRILQQDGVKIISNGIKDVIFQSDINNNVGIINISLNKIIDMEDFLLYLNGDGIYVSRFSACNGDIKEESKILKAMGRDNTSCLNSLRISFGKFSKRDDFYRLVKTISNYLTYYNK